MKKIILISALLLSISTQAQSLLKVSPNEYIPKQEHFNIYSFQVADKCYVGVQNAIAATPLQFYTEVSGGKMLKQAITTKSGAFYTTFKADNMPALVLNNKNTAKRARGNVQFFDKHEFKLAHIRVDKSDAYLNISFEALADNEQKVSYKLYAVNSEGISLLKEYAANTIEQWEYVVFEASIASKTNYILKVFSGDKERYTQKVYSADTEKMYTVYPTIINSTIHIDFLTETKDVDYTITAINGKQIITGVLNEQFNELDLNNISKGTYMLHIGLSNQKLNTTQFIKR